MIANIKQRLREWQATRQGNEAARAGLDRTRRLEEHPREDRGRHRWREPALGVALLAGCASTTVMLSPAPQAPVCDRTATALVLWAPQWRADQKDVPAREAAAATGLQDFFAGSGCFADVRLERVPDAGAATVAAQAAAAGRPLTRVVTVTVRELGPVVRLLSSAALVEGGTEVVLDVAAYPVPRPATPGATTPRSFTVHWRHGGPGVIKGVACLAGDMQAALVAALQPATATR